MAKNVIILGAGASAEVGAPVMSNSLDVAEKLYATNAVGEYKESFARVFKAISCLQAVHSKSELNISNIESVFTAFELAKILNRFPGHAPEAIDQLIEDLKMLIVITLQQQVKFPRSGNQVSSHSNYQKLITSILGKVTAPHEIDTAIITFNYDIAVDMAVFTSNLGIDYGISKELNSHVHLPVLKLHGSLNWSTNTETDEITPWFLRQYCGSRRINSPSESNSPVRIPIVEQFNEFGKRDGEVGPIDNVPVIVPPSWNKADSHRSISKVWSRAAHELSEASSIFIIGYSLPETDSFFRQLYALGTVGDTLLKRFWVFNPDESRDEVFRSLLGPGARERYLFRNISFSGSIGHIQDAIEKG